MSWRDNLYPASFRTASFKVFSASTSGGRRNVVHQYPFRDDPYVEDLGLDTDKFSIQGYVIQTPDNNQDYFAERDLLIKELKKAGPGTLIHPFLGEKTVSLLGNFELNESFREGGMARFSMTFVLAERTEISYPAEVPDYTNAVDQAVENSHDFAKDGFTDVWNKIVDYVGDISDNSANSALVSLASLNKMLRKVTVAVQGAFPAQISKALTILSEAYSDVNNLTTLADACSLAGGIIGMGNGILSLINEYGDLIANQLLGSCSGAVRGTISGPMSGAQSEAPKSGFAGSTMSDPAIVAEDYGKTVTRSILEVSRYGEAPCCSNPSSYGGTLAEVSVTTLEKAREKANQEMMVNIARMMAITIAARCAIRIDYTSHNSVIEIMNEIVAAIDAQLIKLGNDAADSDLAVFDISISDPYGYQALQSLLPIFVKSMQGVGANLAEITDYQVPADVTSSLVLAYNKYNDLDRELEIITRNRPLIKHPGFLPGGQVLEILSV